MTRKGRVLAICLGLVVVVGNAGSGKIGKLIEKIRVRLQEPAQSEPPEETTLRVFLTGYSFWDNTPPQSTQIARPVVHDEAGGTGTYEDPVTIAVGHRIEVDEHSLDFPQGTRFYLPGLQKYAVVEDLCGDGDTPQTGPCHIGYRGHPWLDLYIGGEQHDAEQAEACARQITKIQPVLIHPRADHPVLPGEVLQTACAMRMEDPS